MHSAADDALLINFGDNNLGDDANGGPPGPGFVIPPMPNVPSDVAQNHPYPPLPQEKPFNYPSVSILLQLLKLLLLILTHCFLKKMHSKLLWFCFN